jgi:hypothetical protein
MHEDCSANSFKIAGFAGLRIGTCMRTDWLYVSASPKSNHPSALLEALVALYRMVFPNRAEALRLTFL